jgi:hypothetical protein
MTAFAGAMAVVGAAAIALTMLDHPSHDAPQTLFLLGFIATPWLANYFVMSTATR